MPSSAAACKERQLERQGAPDRSRPDPADRKRLERLIQEAARGYSRPEGAPPRSREEEEDDILRDFLAAIFQMNGMATHWMTENDRQALASLYTARSFSTPEAMGRATRAVRQLLRMNTAVTQRMRQSLRRVQEKIESTLWTPQEKADFWGEVARVFGAVSRPRLEAIEKQQAWAEATTEVYEFVLCHSGQLRFEGKVVRAGSHEVGQEFSEKLKRAKQCRDAFNAATARIHQEQATVLAEWGVTFTGLQSP